MKRKKWPAGGSIKYRAYFNKGSPVSFCLEGLDGKDKSTRRRDSFCCVYIFREALVYWAFRFLIQLILFIGGRN